MSALAALKALLSARAAPASALELAERVAAKAPASLEAVHPTALAEQLRYATRERPDSALMLGSPKEFLRLANPVDLADAATAERVNWLRKMVQSGKASTGPDNDRYYIERLGREFKGFGDVPFLSLSADATPRVTAHEGRHRMHALAKAFGEDTPLAFRINANWKDLSRVRQEPLWMDEPGVFMFNRMREFSRGGLAQLKGCSCHG